jgi:hypothetical protein
MRSKLRTTCAPTLALVLAGSLVPVASDAAPRAARTRVRKPAPRRGSLPAAKPREALDIEKLRVFRAGKYPNAVPTCDVLVVGGGLGGVAAVEALVRQGMTVILTEPTSMLGGQLTSQAVSLPDENSYIEREPGVGTRSYRTLREEFRAKYAAIPGIKPAAVRSPGQAWVSRVSGEPAVWEAAIRDRLATLSGVVGLRQVLTRHQLLEVKRFPHSGRYHYADFVDLDSGRITRVAAKYLLDATETGDGIALAGTPWVIGAEARPEHNEPHAPETARPDWIQSFTYCFAVRWQPAGPHEIVEKPSEYEYFKSLGEYTLRYDYSDARGQVYYKVFEKAPGAGGPFWTYRRIVAASSFKDNPSYAQDVALINWRGNDFHEENPVGKPLDEQIRILKRGKAFAQGFLYWLQTECPRDDGSGAGYPEMQLAKDIMGTGDGFAAHPYIRESRRILAEFTLNENHLAPDESKRDRKWGEEFADTVGIALYAMDIHPSKGEPPFLSRALPYHLPLGSFIPRGGPPNVLPAAKNFGATRLALSSARMHPTEWLAGEVAGHLAAYCVRREADPAAVRKSPALLKEFQTELERSGIPLRWNGIIP